MQKEMPEKTTVKISVKELVAFTARKGDLRQSSGGGPTAAEGMEIHRWIQKSRPKDYLPEISVKTELENRRAKLVVSGRADGFSPNENPPTVEEIKSTVGPLILMSADSNPLHLAQATIYGAVIAKERNLNSVRIRLTYCDVETKDIRPFDKIMSRGELDEFLNVHLESYLDWITKVLEHRDKRNRFLAATDFPYDAERPGQGEMANRVEEAVGKGERLFLEAPTGSGKTMAVLYGTAKAMGNETLDQAFFLTSRTTGRQAAIQAAALLDGEGSLRTLALTAKEKLCPNTQAAVCSPRECQRAKGHNDRIHCALGEAFDSPHLGFDELQTLGEKHRVCPFALSMDLAPFADLVVCDLNYVFDPHVSPKLMGAPSVGKRAFLIDEAHNLVDRSREMFSARIDSSATKAVIKEKGNRDLLARAARKADRTLDRIVDEATVRGATHQLVSMEDLQPLLDATEEYVDAYALATRGGADPGDSAATLFFRLLDMTRAAAPPAKGYRAFVSRIKKNRSADLFCVDPSWRIQCALEGSSAVFFSGTLSPSDYYARVLVGDEDSVFHRAPSPFQKENLLAVHMRTIDARYSKRDSSVRDIADCCRQMLETQPGNYMAFLPSYAYLHKLEDALRSEPMEGELAVQSPGMSDRDKDRFLARFSADSPRSLLGLAVMGGVFAEGIDLPGNNLLGALIVSVGLPALEPRRELIKELFQETDERGFEFAYVYPGMCRVLQAAGRVIRTTSDLGVIVLADRRFDSPPYKEILPNSWRPLKHSSSIDELHNILDEFWTSEVDTKHNQE